MSALIRLVYIVAMRVLRAILHATGVLGAMERRSHHPTWLYLRSLLAIYDLDDMIYLDLPWWNFEATEAVEAFLTARSARAFEYGSGASTFWLARRCASVVSVECESSWHEHLSRHLESFDNVTLRLSPPKSMGADSLKKTRFGSAHRGTRGLSFEEFVRSIEIEEEPFDLIVIDGRAREACLHTSLPQLKPDGLILFDDTVRQRYKDAIAAHPELEVRAYLGRAASLPYRNETTLLRRRDLSPCSRAGGSEPP